MIKNKPRWLISILALSLVFIGGCAGPSASTPSPSSTPANSPAATPPAATKFDGQPLNFVMIGDDTKPEDSSSGRADSIQLIHVPKDRKQVYIISIPRGIGIEIPGHGFNRINSAYQDGGPELNAKTLEKMFGNDFKVTDTLVIGFGGFADLTDAIGGVTLENLYNSSSGGYTWKKGEITIKGRGALEFTRDRKSFPNGNLVRNERMRMVLQAMMAKLLTPEIRNDPVAFVKLATSLKKSLMQGPKTPLPELYSVAKSLEIKGKDDIKLLQVPIINESLTKDFPSLVENLDDRQVAELSLAMKDGKMSEYYAKYRNQPYWKGK